MPLTSKAIANYFLTLAEADGVELTPMKLQKLVYFAHGWHLALTDEPLIDEQVEARPFGPVIPSLYRAFRRYGNEPIREPATVLTKRGVVVPNIRDDLENLEDVRLILDRIWKVYGKYTAVQLSNAAHQAGTPWEKVHQKYQGAIPKGTDIPTELIKEFFQSSARKKATA